MVLSDFDLLKVIKSGELLVSPLDSGSILGHSISLHLSSELHEISSSSDLVDVKDVSTYPDLIAAPRNDFFILERGKVYLSPTLEKVSVPENLCAYIDGTSDLARLGISVVLCGHVAPGFGGRNGSALVLEIQTHALERVKIYSGMRIANLVISELSSTTHASYQTRKEAYNSSTIESSKLYHRVYKP